MAMATRYWSIQSGYNFMRYLNTQDMLILRLKPSGRTSNNNNSSSNNNNIKKWNFCTVEITA